DAMGNAAHFRLERGNCLLAVAVPAGQQAQFPPVLLRWPIVIGSARRQAIPSLAVGLVLVDYQRPAAALGPPAQRFEERLPVSAALIDVGHQDEDQVTGGHRER